MKDTASEQIIEALREVGAPGSYSARRTATAEDLHIEIKGMGPLRFPISSAQAQSLCRIVQPARYGKGTQTLLDRRVRDTGEIPKSRVKIDQRRWNRTLLPVLDALRADLGLPEGSKLKAELHGLLVYAPGQFFRPHQDSEKSDEMIGTLVVTLPATFRGGAIVVEHQGEHVEYRATQQPLSFIAFYADCRHEVRPVKSGHRIVLTYNLMLAGEPRTGASRVGQGPTVVNELAEQFRRYFATPFPLREWEKEDGNPRKLPSRLVCLLDHQYTERGLSWHRLKGQDAARAAALQAAAEHAGCEVVLALAKVHEIWDCAEEDWDRSRYRRRRSWHTDEFDDEIEDDEPPAKSSNEYTLGDLQDRSITLECWLDPTATKAESVATQIADREVCATTPSSALKPYASEYEGYMGNYGNTMDRWYRRAAIVLWPRELTFAVRSEASPAWALEALKKSIQAREVAEAQAMATALKPHWQDVAHHEAGRKFFDQALRVALGLEEPELAAFLLSPFSVEALSPARARVFIALLQRYGETWVRSLLTEWALSRRAWLDPAKQFAWLTALPRLCESLRGSNDALGTSAAHLLLEDRWLWLKRKIEGLRGLLPPSRRDEELAKLAQPILGFLESLSEIGEADTRNEAVAYLCAEENEPLFSMLLLIMRQAAKKPTPTISALPGLNAIAHHLARRLEGRLKRPARRKDDWSIALPPGCDCELCGQLATFLSDRQTKQLLWPLAKERRLHVHDRISKHELPVRHETLRTGSPHKLVLTKMPDLSEREEKERRSWQADLEWLDGAAFGGDPKRRPAAKKGLK